MPRKPTMTAKQRLKKIYDYNNEYARRSYDRFSINFPKGYKEIIANHCLNLGISINEYIKQLVLSDMGDEINNGR